MKKFREYFIAHYFMRFGNGKFLIIEGAYFYMIVACAILAWGTLEYYDTWLIIPFLLPFLFGAYLVIFAPKIKNIDDLEGHWRTQLRLLSDPKMSHVFNHPSDKRYEERLRRRWNETYEEDWEDTQMVKMQPWQPLWVVIIVLIVVWIWSIL